MIYHEQWDATVLNRIANDPSVAPFVNYNLGEMDWTPALKLCVCLTNGEDAFAVFEHSGDREWQTHTMFLPTCRGKRGLDTAREIVNFMRPHANALWGATPIANKAARWFNRKMGCKIIGNDVYEAEGPVELFRLELN